MIFVKDCLDNKWRKIKQDHFPDGTLLLKTEGISSDIPMRIKWLYENDAELFTIICLAKKLEYKNLEIPYCPHARQDRIKHGEDTFTLKYFAEIINSLGFNLVHILDPHSPVCEALIDRVVVESPKKYIYEAIGEIERDEELILCFPDAGACKRYADMFPRYKYVYGNKVRKWETGEIVGTEIVNPFNVDLTNKTILMIDDIVSYGGSLKYTADKLKEFNVETIYAYATHTENSVLDKEKGTLIKSLEDGTVERLFTTNSIFNKVHDKIEVIELD